MIIIYEIKKFLINTKNIYKKIKSTWKWEYYLWTKNKFKNKTRFGNSTFKGLRNILNDKFKFYLEGVYSDIWDKIYNEESNEINSDNSSSNLSKNFNNISDNS